MNLISVLEEFGFSEKQAKVYIACLELGSATAQSIAKRSAIGRSTTYFLLEDLAKKGYVTFFDKGKIKHFTVENPNRLAVTARSVSRNIETLMPELKRLWGQTQSQSQSHVRFFEGIDRIKELYDELLTLGLKEYYVFGSTEFWMKADQEWFTDYIRRRAEAGISIKLLVEDSPDARAQKKYELEIGGAEVKIIPKKFTYFGAPTSDAAILPDRVIFQNYGREMTSTVLYSKEAADLMRIWFNMTWQLIK